MGCQCCIPITANALDVPRPVLIANDVIEHCEIPIVDVAERRGSKIIVSDPLLHGLFGKCVLAEAKLDQ